MFAPSRKPCRIIYEFPDGSVEEYTLVQSTRRSPGSAPLTSATSGPSGKVASPLSVNEPLFPTSTDTPEVPPPRTDDKALAVTPAAPGGAPVCCCELCRPEKCKDINSSTNPRIGSPGPMTLFAFGLTTAIYNVHVAQIHPLNMVTIGLMCFYGGLAQFVGGFFELMNMNSFFCTLDISYGAFWMATGLTNLVPGSPSVTTDAPHMYMGGFFMLWFFFASTMLVVSLKTCSFVQIALFFSVALNFLLNTIGNFTNTNTLKRVAGFEGIVVGSLAVYTAMAFTLREAYGFSVLPILFQKNFRYTEW